MQPERSKDFMVQPWCLPPLRGLLRVQGKVVQGSLLHTKRFLSWSEAAMQRERIARGRGMVRVLSVHQAQVRGCTIRNSEAEPLEPDKQSWFSEPRNYELRWRRVEKASVPLPQLSLR